MISLSPERLARYRGLVALLLRHRGAKLTVADGGWAEGKADPDTADRLPDDLERLGPTFVKLGQLLSTRADLLPPPYLESLTRLQDRVQPFPFEAVEETVSAELGVRLTKVFTAFAEEPLAAASLGQVHKATLRDGRVVAVKVQRPGIREQVAEDFAVLDDVLGLVDATHAASAHDLSRVLEELRESIERELDFLREASHLKTLAANLESFRDLVVPRPVDDLTTSRVLTMTLVDGTRLDRLSGVVRVDVPGARLAEELFAAYLHQILVDGFFHADPHPGNVLLTRDHRLALLDLGMVGHVSPALQDRLLKLLLAVAQGDGDEAARHVLALSRVPPEADVTHFARRLARRVSEHRDAAMGEIRMGRLVLEISRVAGEAGIQAPPDLTMLGKTLLDLDHVSRELDPTFEPNAAIRDHAADLMRRRMRKAAGPGKTFAALLEAKELAERMPERVNRILELVASNQLELHLRGVQVPPIVEALQKLANRIAAGLVVAALIVGAALMMRVETGFRLFGYSGLPMIFFLTAAAVGLWMLWDILRRDPERRRIRRP